MKKKMFTLFSVVMMLGMLSGCGPGNESQSNPTNSQQVSQEKAEFITESEAAQIALERVPGADESNLVMNIEEDDGNWSYEGTIVYNEQKYECSIDAVTGEMLVWEDETYDD